MKRSSKSQSKNDEPKTKPNQHDADIRVLEQFDLNQKYGPAYGVTRLERWEWANSRNLNPPNEVKLLILNNLGDKSYVNGIWSKYYIL